MTGLAIAIAAVLGVCAAALRAGQNIGLQVTPL